MLDLKDAGAWHWLSIAASIHPALWLVYSGRFFLACSLSRAWFLSGPTFLYRRKKKGQVTKFKDSKDGSTLEDLEIFFEFLTILRPRPGAQVYLKWSTATGPFIDV